VLHGEINHMLVGFGQTICLPVSPKCGECTLSTAGLCPAAQSTSTRTRTKTSIGKKRSDSFEGSVREGSGSGPKIEIETETDRGVERPRGREAGLVKEEQ